MAAGAGEAGTSLTLVVARLVDSPCEAVFDAWLDAESVAQWLFATPGGVMERVHIEPRVGGAFEVFERRGEQLATHYGRYVKIERPQRLAFDFATDREGASSPVTVVFEARRDGCLVTLTHEVDAAWAEHQERVKAGWAGILAGLERALTGGGMEGTQ